MATIPTYDIVFLLDNTGSMDAYVTAVRNNIIPFANSLDEKKINYRLGLVSFGDINDGETDGKVKNYGFGNAETFTNNVNSILDNLSWGADAPESGLEAIVQGDQSALAMIDSSTAKYKRFVVVTDASFHDQGDTTDYVTGDPATFLNSSDVLNSLKDAGVVLDVIGTLRTDNPYDPCQDEWEPLANSTGGNFYDINGNYSMLFEEIADDIIEEVNKGDGDPSSPLKWFTFSPDIKSVTDEPKPVAVTEPAPLSPEKPVINSEFEGRIMLAQWGYGFTPTEDSPLFGNTPSGGE